MRCTYSHAQLVRGKFVSAVVQKYNLDRADLSTSRSTGRWIFWTMEVVTVLNVDLISTQHYEII